MECRIIQGCVVRHFFNSTKVNELELRMFCISNASNLDNDTPNDIINAAEVIYMWLTGIMPETHIAAIDKGGGIIINPSDN